MFFSYSEYLYIKKYFKLLGVFFQRLKSFDLRILLYSLYETVLHQYSYVVLMVNDIGFIKNFLFFHDFLVNNDKMNFVSSKNSKKLQRFSNIMFNLKFIFMYNCAYLYTREYIFNVLLLLNDFRNSGVEFINFSFYSCMLIFLKILNFYKKLFKIRILFIKN